MLTNNSITEADVKTKWHALKESASRRKIPFNLSKKHVKNLLCQERCYYTGVPIIIGKNFSIDRKDNSKGYNDSNTVACDKNFNCRKNDLTIKEISILYNKVVGSSDLLAQTANPWFIMAAGALSIVIGLFAAFQFC